MASKPPKKEEKEDRPERPAKQEPSAEAKPPRRLSRSTLLIAVAVLAAQAALIVGGLVLLRSGGGPSHASAQQAASAEAAKPVEEIEELIVEGKATNIKRGVTYVYIFKVYGVIDKPELPAVKAISERRKATIEDTVRQVVARLEPRDLDEEPELATLRRVLMHEFEQVFGPGKVKELRVPEWTRKRVDY